MVKTIKKKSKIELTQKQKVLKVFKRLERMSKLYGFDKINYSEYSFYAEDKNGVNIYIASHYGNPLTVEISWSSAGIPRPTDIEVHRHIVAIEYAQKLKKYFLSEYKEN